MSEAVGSDHSSYFHYSFENNESVVAIQVRRVRAVLQRFFFILSLHVLSGKHDKCMKEML